MPIVSMTGFGAASGAGLRVEARSVNSRFLEIKIRQPFGAEVETRLRKLVKAGLGRGRVDVFVAMDAEARAAGDEAQWRAGVGEMLDELKLVQADAASKSVEISPVNPLELLEISKRKSGGGRSEAPSELDEILSKAVHALNEMRATEGDALAKVLAALVDELETQVHKVADTLAGEPKRLLQTRVDALNELLGEVDAGKVNPDAVAREVALLVQRGDVREEVDRLASHFAQARGVLAAPASVGQGKRLDFLTQEILREVTTMGSKITAHAGSALLIEAKATIERMREQVQNVQ